MKTNQQVLRGRLSTETINSYYQRNKKHTLISGEGAYIPIVYGAQPVDGHIVAYKIDVATTSDIYIAVAWSLGEIRQIRKVFINDAEPTANVRVRHYRGTTWQSADIWLSGQISGYSDDLILSLPDSESLGVAYSTFRIPENEYTSVPRFKALIDGQLVSDPRTPVGEDDILGFYEETGFAFDFSTEINDHSIYGNEISTFGSVSVTGGYLNLAGSPGDYATIATDVAMDWGADNWTFEFKFRTHTVATGTYVNTLFMVGNTDSTWGLWVYRDGNDTGTALKVQVYNKTGAATVVNGTAITTMAVNTLYDVKIERMHTYVHVYVNGSIVIIGQLSGTDEIEGDGLTWTIGRHANGTSGTEFDGDLLSMRLTVGSYRYGSVHSTGVTTTPFSDSGKHKAGATGFSTNPALHWQDLVAEPLYGLGASVDTSKTVRAADWCDDQALGTSGLTPRAQTGLVLDQPRPVEEYLDILATYANSVWFIYGAYAEIKSDQPYTTGVNASGRELVEYGDFSTAFTAWTYDASYWSQITSPPPLTLPGTFVGPRYYAKCTSPPSDKPLSQDITTVSGVTYAISLDSIDLEAWGVSGTNGSLKVTLGGTTVIASTTAKGHLVGTKSVVTGGTETLSIIGESGIIGVDNVSVRPLVWEDTDWIADSLTLEGLSEVDSPTQVSLRWRLTDTTTPNWQEQTTTVSASGVSSGNIPLRPTTLYMPGVGNADEAADKAQARLNRLQDRVRVSWVTRDAGMVQQRGDIVRLTSTYRGIDLYVKVATVDLVEPGRWRITGMKYDVTHYPN